jgi:beta-RFAP synthase
MTARVTVATGARLHCGLLNEAGTHAGRFAGVGLMIDRPGVRLTAEPADADTVTMHAAGSDAGRVRRFVDTYRRNVPPDRQPPPCRIDVTEVIPPHAGLGSGTQLALATASALAALAGDTEALTDPFTLARRVGRGRRSAIGTAGLMSGGLLVDHGGPASPGGERVTFHPVPADWRIVLATPRQQAGLSGETEIQAFEQLPRLGAGEMDRLWQIVQAELLPAHARADCAAFGEALFCFGQGVGRQFAAVQGGTYATRETAALVEWFRHRSLAGVGQTSWGPTVFAIAPDDQTAARTAGDLASEWPQHELTVSVTAPRAGGSSRQPR